MYMVPIKTLLAPSFGHFRPHEELLAAGALVEYDESMAGRVLFVSHAWLRSAHPDNEQGVKFALLRALLRRAVEGPLAISPHWMTAVAFRNANDFRLRSTDVRRRLPDLSRRCG